MKSMKMNLLMFVSAMTVLSTTVFGQYVETTIPLPDSFNGISAGWAIANNEVTNRVYIGGIGSSIIAVDGLTNQKIARIQFSNYWSDRVTDLTCNSARNKIYAGWMLGVVVIDGSTNNIIKNIYSCYMPTEMLYIPVNDYIYVFNNYYGMVIDCQTDSVIRYLNLYGNPYDRKACYKPNDNRIYYINDYSIVIMDAATSSIIDNIPLYDIYAPLFMIYNNISNKIYYGDKNGIISIIDCSTDSVTTRLSNLGWLFSSTFNPAMNRLYVSSIDSTITVIDGAGDSVLYEIHEPWAFGLACDSDLNKIYCSVNHNAIAVYDGANDSLIKYIDTGKQHYQLLYTPGTGKIYGIDYSNSQVPIIDCARDTLVANVSLGAGPSFLCFANNNKVYSGNLGSGNISVIDGMTNGIVATIDVGGDPGDLAYNAANNRVYASIPSMNCVVIIDCDNDSIITRLNWIMNARALEYNPHNNKMYCASCPDYSTGTDTITIIDGNTNAIISKVPAGQEPRDLVYDSDDNRIYCSLYRSQTVIALNGETDSIVATIPMHTPCNWNLAYNPTNNKIYVANEINSRMEIVNCNNNQVINTVDVGGNPRNVIYHSPTNTVYCSSYSGDQITAINGTTDSVEATIGVPRGPTAMLSDPVFDRIYCAKDGSDSIAIIDGQTNTIRKTLQVGTQPIAFARNPYSNRIYVANFIGSSVSVIRDGAEIEETGPAAAMPLGLLLSPNPAQSLVKVRLAGIEGQARVRLTEVTLTLYDITGRSVKTVRIPVAVNSMTFDVSDLPAGVYFVGSDGGTKNGFQKLVITR